VNAPNAEPAEGATQRPPVDTGDELASRPVDTEVVVIGTGFSGLGMGIALVNEGRHDFVILEKATDVGGTWRDNSYPGCAVDVQSHLYSFSFAPNPDWTHVYSPQAEIWAYIKKVSDAHDVLRHVRYGHEVTGGDWDESAQRWAPAPRSRLKGRGPSALQPEAHGSVFEQQSWTQARVRGRGRTFP